jgi:hypothetical protein
MPRFFPYYGLNGSYACELYSPCLNDAGQKSAYGKPPFNLLQARFWLPMRATREDPDKNADGPNVAHESGHEVAGPRLPFSE